MEIRWKLILTSFKSRKVVASRTKELLKPKAQDIMKLKKTAFLTVSMGEEESYSWEKNINKH